MPDLDLIRGRVERELSAFLDREQAVLTEISPALQPVADEIRSFVAVGKRLRPAFAWWGALGAGAGESEELVRACTALELVQACALVHDDLMDGSDTRRGQPSVHRRFTARHAGGGWTGDSAAFGESVALLIGDLCLIWAGQLLNCSGLPLEALHRARPVYDLMCTEVMSGQYLDVLEQATGNVDPDRAVERALRVTTYKSAKYTIERPLHLGAAIASAGPDVIDAYTAYGVPLGEAFQLRDDVLGVFGDPAETGKPAGDDLREGKRTVLIALTLQRASEPEAEVVRTHLGDPELDAAGVERMREVITGSGAWEAVEQLVEQRLAQALAALVEAPVTSEAGEALAGLALLAARRVG